MAMKDTGIVPALPKSFEAPGGRVNVRLVKRPKDHDDADHKPKKNPCWGTYSASLRRVEIDKNADPRFQCHTFWHEWAHVALMDGGVAEVLGPKKEEAVCEAVATAMMRLVGFK